MEKIIKIGDKDVRFKATAATPMKYRNSFPGKDLFRDLIALEESDDGDMEIFERIAYSMSDAQAEGLTLEDWLEQFELMDLVTALPEIMSLWEDNADTQSLTEKNG